MSPFRVWLPSELADRNSAVFLSATLPTSEGKLCQKFILLMTNYSDVRRTSTKLVLLASESSKKILSPAACFEHVFIYYTTITLAEALAQHKHNASVASRKQGAFAETSR